MIRITTSYISPGYLVNRCFFRAVGIKAGQIQDKPSKASPEQLNIVADQLSNRLVKFFSAPHPFGLYTKDVVFIDNIRSVRTQGISQYAIQIALIKLYYAVRYSSNKLELLSLVRVPEESCIRIRWRIITKPGIMQFFFMLHKFRSTENWKDGISTMHVNKDGLIHCHVCDNIDVDLDEGKIGKTIKKTLVNRGLHV